jgi:phosphoglycolate phosphatase-like HAD superfamily hydrolase
LSALVLFDIDGTLLLSGGAGVRAMTRAFEDVFGVVNAFDGIPVAGNTDTFLVGRALAQAGLDDRPEAHARFRRTYLKLLPEEIQRPGTGRKAVMPGVRALLAAIAGRDTFHPALLTGNYERAARIKLTHFDLHRYFSWGVFGDDAADRNELGRLALARAIERAVPAAARANAVIIGDTPQDIACARAAGARAIAVATGMSTAEHLHAAGADAVLADLSDTAAVLSLLIE